MGVPGIPIGNISIGMADDECGQAQVRENRKYQYICEVHNRLLHQPVIALVEVAFPGFAKARNIGYVTPAVDGSSNCSENMSNSASISVE